MKAPRLILSTMAICCLSAGCDRTAPEAAESEAAAPASTPSVEVVEAVATPVEPRAEPMPPESVPGRYRDPAVPGVLYEFEDGDRWTATWETTDGSRGLMMEGMYQIEKGEVLHLLVMQFGRRGAGSIGDWDLRAPPQPRPRAFFRIEGNELVIMPERTAQAFTMAPFTAARLAKVAQ